MKKRKILYVSGTRSDYGLIRNALFNINRHKNMELEIVATGMHIMPDFGNTAREMRKDRFRPWIVKAIFKGDKKDSASLFMGNFIINFSKQLKNIKPDIVMIQGDRPEMLAAATVCTYAGIPLVHTHGGEVTSTVDEPVRHAISKLSHIHLAATKKSAERLIKMGENPWRVFIVGAPGLDEILKKKYPDKVSVAKEYRLNLSRPIVLVIQHAVSGEVENAENQMTQTLKAISELKYQCVIIYPNADPGSKDIIKVIEKFRQYPFIQIFKNIDHCDYLGLMSIAGVIVGNSSSAIVEAPSFHLPAVNIGSRQNGRERAGNTIDVDYGRKEIKEAIKKAVLDTGFASRVKKIKNPYGDGKAGTRIARILSRIKINKKLLQKQISY